MGPSATICRIRRSSVPCGRSGFAGTIPRPPTHTDYTPRRVEAQGMGRRLEVGCWRLVSEGVRRLERAHSGLAPSPDMRDPEASSLPETNLQPPTPNLQPPRVPPEGGSYKNRQASP